MADGGQTGQHINSRLELTFLAFLWLMLGACGPGSPAAWPGPSSHTPAVAALPPLTVTRPPPPSTATPTPAANPPTPTASPSASLVKLWIDGAFPGEIALPRAVTLTQNFEDATLKVEQGNGGLISHWIYALVAPFSEPSDGITVEELQSLWLGESAGSAAARTLLVDPQSVAAFTRLWQASPGAQVRIFPAGQLLQEAWAQPSTWALVPFERIQPRWKVLAVDDQSPLRRDFDPGRYPLVIPFSLTGPPDLIAALTGVDAAGAERLPWPVTNRDPARLTVLVMSGVTALVRATAWTMELQGITYPARDIGGWLREADITHVSNEVPFAENCPYPDPGQEGVIFCSDPKYIELLEDIGTDVVELTGDHFHDWGAEAMLYTLELYRERGWLTYGGGQNYEEGIQPALIEHNGNKLAFIGCNGKGGGFARASAVMPGSVACDRDWMRRRIAELSQQGYLVVATFQHAEYYSYAAPAAMRPDFRDMAESGAVIVSGSQAHQPHGFEFWSGGFIHYGLGNLFFDQYGISDATRQGVIDRHVFYDGRYLGVELLTYRFEDYARARPMTPAERRSLLTTLFTASGW